MKISIITAVKNNRPGLLRAIECVRSQTYKNVEHIIVDGGSTDGSQGILRGVYPTNSGAQNDILRQAQDDSEPATHNQQPTPNLPTGQAGYQLISISETDTGIYDAINKGIKLATGDVIGLLHSDDLYADQNVIDKYVSAFNQPTTNNKQQTIDAVYSDLVYVSQKSDSGQAGMTEPTTTHYSLLNTNYSVIRYWKTQEKEFTTESQRNRALQNGWMPPHPTLFIRKEVFNKYGLYNTDLKIASDYEMILRLLFKYKITSRYLPYTTYLMSIGGASNKSINNILVKSKEDLLAIKLHNLPHPLTIMLRKNFRKLPQFLARDLS